MGIASWPKRFVLLVVGLLLTNAVARGAGAQEMPIGVLDVRYTAAPRAQIAIWLEDAEGRFVATLRLTEATAYRGIGNRPGASEMNSGYRWPYGRREGVLPIWAARRAAGPDARAFPRVIFQDRIEGYASRTSTDGSVDDYFCLSFNRSTTTREALDAVSCASVFTSDKGRYLTEDDVASLYTEPYVQPSSNTATTVQLPLESLYPARMDVTRCTETGCFDHPDVARFADDVRAVMPEIDAVTMATPRGGQPQSELITIPPHWPAGDYTLWLEVNVEGDYNEQFDADVYPTPRTPSGTWDTWALDFGYPYRGQPSVAFAVPIALRDGTSDRFATAQATGRASWDVWTEDYGALEAMTGMSDDPSGAPGSGADRLYRDTDGNRLVVEVEVLGELGKERPPASTGEGPTSEPEPGVDDPTTEPADPAIDPEPDDGASDDDPAGRGDDRLAEPRIEVDVASPGNAIIITESEGSGVGPIHGLSLTHYESNRHAHEWVNMRFVAPESELSLHRYEVRVAEDPIVDAASFLRFGRPAKAASDDAEGATSLMLPVDVRAGEPVEAVIGDLVASTHYYVAVRGVDRFNREGPISVAEVDTPERQFTTVTPCFVASVTYGTPLSREVSVLRRVRDRLLMSHAPGRALVAAYYAHGPGLAAWLSEKPRLRAGVRVLLDVAVWAFR